MNRRPKWERNEILVVLELGHRRGWPKSVSRTDPEIIAISQALRAERGIAKGSEHIKARNPEGVARKYSDLQCLLPRSTAHETNGGATTRRVIAEYLDTPQAILLEAEQAKILFFKGDQPRPGS